MTGTVDRRGVALPPTWRVAPADEALRRRYHEPGFDDDGWERATVPGHWQLNPSLKGSDGPVLHRVHFDLPSPGSDERLWLSFDGILYQSDIWLDGAYLGDTEGYFFAHAFEITRAAETSTRHELAVEVSCARPADHSAKRTLTGVLQDWDSIDTSRNPGGIWAPVRVERSGPVRIVHSRVVCIDASPTQAAVRTSVVLDSVDDSDITLVSHIAGVDHHQSASLATGRTRVEWTVVIPDPPLWWPYELGGQPLADWTVDVLLADGATSDQLAGRIGLRSVGLDDWVLSVNGERLFVRGAAQGPTDAWPAASDPALCRRDVELARDAHLNLLRLVGHVAHPALYSAADELGVLLWQDLPLHRGYHRSVRRQAVRQAREAVDLLGHHPSVAMWCAHSDVADDRAGTRGPAIATSWAATARDALAQQLPDPAGALLDRSLVRTLRRADGSRPVIPRSGRYPGLPRLDGTDAAIHFGWEDGDDRQLSAFCRAWPRMARFVTGLGTQSVPSDDAFVDRALWPDLDWANLTAHHSMQADILRERIGPALFENYEAWAAETRRFQARVVRYQVEALRLLKYRPTGGFLLRLFADSAPGVTWSVLGADREPKEAYGALAAACAPLLPIAQRPPAHVHPGDHLRLEVHVVNDLRELVGGAKLTASVRWAGGGHTQVWTGDIPADSVVRIGRVDLLVPEVEGAVELDLVLVLDLDRDPRRTVRHYGTIVLGHHDHDHDTETDRLEHRTEGSGPRQRERR